MNQKEKFDLQFDSCVEMSLSMHLYQDQRHRDDLVPAVVFPFLPRPVAIMPTLQKTSLLLCKVEYRLEDKSESKEDPQREKQRSILLLHT